MPGLSRLYTFNPALASQPEGLSMSSPLPPGETVRFNPPPNWPAPPPDWSPPRGWRPNPSWGPPPPDWQWWVPGQPAADPVPAGGTEAGASTASTSSSPPGSRPDP